MYDVIETIHMIIIDSISFVYHLKRNYVITLMVSRDAKPWNNKLCRINLLRPSEAYMRR